MPAGLLAGNLCSGFAHIYGVSSDRCLARLQLFCRTPYGPAASDFFTGLGRGKCHGTSAVSLLKKPLLHFMQTCIKWFGASVHTYRITNSIKRISSCARLGAIGFRLRATVPGMSVILSENGNSGCNGFITICRMALT
jgi:hypothetical protein